MKTLTATAWAVMVDLFAGTGGWAVGVVLVLIPAVAFAVITVAVFSPRDEPTERLIGLIHGRAPRDPPDVSPRPRGARR